MRRDHTVVGQLFQNFSFYIGAISPMAIWKATYFFAQFQDATIGAGAALGWTESWYKESADPIQTVIADPGIDDYLKYRLACMTDYTRCTFIRVSEVTGGRRNFKLRSVIDGTGTIKTTTTTKLAQSTCGILVDLERVPGLAGEVMHHRRFIMRGLPSDVIHGNSIHRGENWKAFLEFFSHIAGNPSGGKREEKIPISAWGIRWDTSSPSGVAIDRLLVAPTVDERHILVTPQVAGAFLGDLVQVQGIPAPGTEANRFWRFAGPVTLIGVTYSLLVGARKPIDVDYTGPGRGRYRLTKFSSGTISQHAVIGLRTKKTGRPSHQSRGRR